MDNLPPPKPLDTSSASMAEAWRKWKVKFNIYLEATQLVKESEKRKIAIMLHTIGDEPQELEETFEYTNEKGEQIQKHDVTLQMVIDKFEKFYIPKKNTTYERRKFLTTIQKENQSIEDYIAELKKMAKSCEYGSHTEDFIKDQLVGGIREETLRERMLRTTDLNLQKAIDICRARETAKYQLQTFIKSESPTEKTTDIAILRKNNTTEERRTNRANRIEEGYRTTARRENRQQRYRGCSRCGSQHEPRQCPAYGKKCMNCGIYNHFAKACRRRRVQELETEGTSEEEESEVFLLELREHNKNTTLDSVIQVENIPITFRLDTGAQANVLPLEIWEQLPTKTPLQRTTKNLVTYTRQPVKLVGESILECQKNKKTTKLKFLITKENYGAILGLKACYDELKLIQIREINGLQTKETREENKGGMEAQTLINEYSDVFQGLGELKGRYHISLKEGAIPKIHAPRKIPFALQSQVKKEIDKMEKQGIIKKVKEPTEWVNPIVIVKKPNGSLRICLDPRELNEAMKRPHYKMPTFDEISSKMGKAKYFTIADGSRAFLQKKLDHESSLLCTFATPFGRYRFLRLPYGIKAAPEVFQREMSEMLESHPYAEPFIDDIIIWGETMEKHNRNLEKFLRIARNKGLKLEKNKLQLAKREVKYLGHRLTEEGIKIDEEKKKAITEMPVPKSREELLRFLGMANFLMKYLPGLATIVAPLRELLKKNNEWCWYKTHEKAVQDIKKKLTEAPTLAYFNNRKPVEITADASPEGLGAILEQENKVIAYASTTLNQTQKRYAHIEKELLAVTYACEKFHQYTFGRHFIVNTDHKPLIAMSKKPLPELTTRIQRLFMRLQKYDVELKYKPGREMYVPDTLSRAALKTQECTTEGEDVIIQQILQIQDNQKLQQVREATKEDDTLTRIKGYIKKGWPKYYKEIPDNVKPYWKEKDSILCTADGLIMRKEQIIIPKKLQKEMLDKLHESHQGITNTKRRAKTTIFWPQMNQQIEEMTSKCTTCQKFQNNNPKQPYLPHHIPDTPWSKIAADFFQFQNKNYVQIIDYYSKYIEVQQIKNLQATTVIPVLKAIFARHGIPQIIVTDGGPPFNGQPFEEFMTQWEIKHIKTSPHHPQSNGEVERSIQTVKKMFQKVLENNKDPYLGLLTIRTTPVMGSQYTPAQLLMGRDLETLLPRRKTNYIKAEDHRRYREQLTRKSEELKERNSKSRVQPQLEIGQKVIVRREDKKWHPATITDNVAPRAYTVRTQRGNTITRNQKHIRGDSKTTDWTNRKQEEEEETYEETTENNKKEEHKQKQEEKKESVLTERKEEKTEIPKSVSDQSEISCQRTSKGREIKTPTYLKDYVTN